ncbi:MAG: ring-opening amidohydrolase [Granulosicoccus sp.]
MQRCAQVFRLPMQSPNDVSKVESLIKSGALEPQNISAILGKTEGNGCVNDFTRGYATQSLRSLLSRYLSGEQIESIPMVMSGGTEGGLAPHWIVLGITEAVETDTASLAIAGLATRSLNPNEIGRVVQAELVRDAVLKAMGQANIDCPGDVHYVQVKCPLLTAERVSAVNGDVSTDNTLKSMGLSRGASALGIALALGEIDKVDNGQIGSDLSLWSSRASCSAGIELLCCEVVVLGQSRQWSGPLQITHTVMQDCIDAAPVSNLLNRVFTDQIGLPNSQSNLIATFAKAEASTTGMIRGNRHTMLDDSDISSTRHARGFVGGMLSGLTGTTELFVSGGAEHQGPDGGGPFAIVYNDQ